MILSKRCCTEIFDVATARQLIEAARQSNTYAKCPRCKAGVLRPRVYLFGDGHDHFINIQQELDAWQQIRQDAIRDGDGDVKASVCMLEIGCGLRVPTIRKRFEEILLESSESPSTRLIRVNPDYSGLLPSSHHSPQELQAKLTEQKKYIPVPSTGLQFFSSLVVPNDDDNDHGSE